MAKIVRPDGSLASGKFSKNSKEVHRTRNGKEQGYIMNSPKGPASKAQKAYRILHGKINAIVNTVIANPGLYKEFEAKMQEYNSSHPNLKFVTVRQFAYAITKEKILRQSPDIAQKLHDKSALPRGLKLHIKPFAELSAADIYEILKARFSVFVLEQGIRYLDEDDIDYTATHLALRRKGQVVAYARLFEQLGDNPPAYDEKFLPKPSPRIMRAGRMLTTEHGKGYGRVLMEHLCAEAKRQGADILRIHAQVDAVPFYRRFRFAKLGEPFIEAGIPHILMERKLTRTSHK